MFVWGKRGGARWLAANEGPCAKLPERDWQLFSRRMTQWRMSRSQGGTVANWKKFEQDLAAAFGDCHVTG